MNRVDLLIEILFDRTVDLGGRHDVAMDLRLYPQGDRALKALEKAGSNPDEDDLITSSCGESIGEILVEQGKFRKEFVENLVPLAQDEAIAIIKLRKPEWIDKYDLTEFLA